jgi:hypothetical protein
MMAAAREAIANARARGITDSQFLSDIGSASAGAVERAVARGVTNSTELTRIGRAVGDAVSSIKIASHFDEIAKITDLAHIDDAARGIANRLRNMINSGQIRKLTGGKIDASVVTVAVDRKTGKVYYGISGKNAPDAPLWNPTRRNTVSQSVSDRLEAVGESKTNYDLDNCGEYNSINNATSSGVNMNDLDVYSIDIRYGNHWDPCINCQDLYDDFVRFIPEG